MFLKKLPWLRQLLGKCGFRRAVNFRGVVNSVGRSRMKSVDFLRTERMYHIHQSIIYISELHIYQSNIYSRVSYTSECHINQSNICHVA